MSLRRRNIIVAVYVAAFVAAAASLLAIADWSLEEPAARFRDALLAYMVLAVVSEAAFLRLSIGTSTSSVAYIPNLATLVLLGPAWAMVCAGAATLVGETVFRRKPAVKVAFNVSKDVAAIGIAGFLYVALGGEPSLAVFRGAPIAFGVAVAAFFLINASSTAGAIALSSGTPFAPSLHRLVGSSLLFDLLSTPLALLMAFLYTTSGLVGLIVVVLPLFLVRHVHSVNLRLEESHRDLLELMVKAIEARDPYTSGHSIRVSRVAGIIARALGMTSKQIEEVETAALLHDVGKIHDEFAPILRKPDRLTETERALMQTHAIRSYELVRTISQFRNGVDLAVRHHHENVDGSGYPDGLQGEDIPLAARIIMVADTTDAMTTDRPYRPALTFERVVSELQKYSGLQFDPQVVQAFIASPAIRPMLDERREPTGSVYGDRASSPGIAYVG